MKRTLNSLGFFLIVDMNFHPMERKGIEALVGEKQEM
jgi:hypothetical protein